MSSINVSNVLKNCECDSKRDVVNKNIIRVGSRKSELALVQTNHVISLLKKLYPHQKFEIHKMTTVGDRVLNISLPKIGEKSLFTKDLEDALRSSIVDFVVHSLKDLPTALPGGMAIGAVLEREDARDALVLAKKYDGKCFRTLPEGAIIGTSSLRRTAQLSRLYPHLKVHDIRGNLNTRLAKLDAADSKYAGIVLAQAGLVRLGWQNRIAHTIDPEEILYAIGQGALAVECRSTDTKILTMLQNLVCHQTQCRILAERSFLKTLGGGCSAPVAVNSILGKRKDSANENKYPKSEYELRMIGSVWSLDGKTEIQAENSCYLDIKTNTESEEDAIPSKRKKISIEIDESNELNAENPSPPSVVDHSQVVLSTFNASDTNQSLDITGILNVHSDAFQKCPYSSIVQSNKSTVIADTQKSTDTSVDDQCPKCPLDFAVGHDVMGQCPFFDSKNTIETLSKVPSSCGKCPFKNGCGSKDSQPNVLNENAAKPALDVKKCPFLTSSASSSKDPVNISSAEDFPSEKVSDPLFCGIYAHNCYPLDVFEACEQLGKDLATKLIENGALSVMECAQNEIRNKA